MHVVMSIDGTAGNVYPLIALGCELKRRRHDVEFHGCDYFPNLLP